MIVDVDAIVVGDGDVADRRRLAHGHVHVAVNVNAHVDACDPNLRESRCTALLV